MSGFGTYSTWSSPSKLGGSDFFGDLYVLQTRWHTLVEPGMWQVIISYKGYMNSFYAVTDDFGTLIPVRSN